MPVYRARGAALVGIEAVVVDVEVDSRQGLPRVLTVGLPDATVRESEDRVRAAIRNSGFKFPGSRLTVNLAPADLRKGGSGLDVAVAIGILGTTGVVPEEAARDHLLLGELSLDGRLRPVPGTLPAALTARRLGMQGIIVAPETAHEGAAAGGIAVRPAGRLVEVVEFLRGERSLEAQGPVPPLEEPEGSVPDLAEVKGQGPARRALEVAAAGGHNLLLIGPPGAGKTLLARCMPRILPPLDEAGAVEVACIRSASGEAVLAGGVSRRPPFRAPHHSISPAGMIGGGSDPRPGEVSLAHGGVLFLDEMLEFSRLALESLRQPLESGTVTVARARRSLTFPAAFCLVGAMNPCPCGQRGDPKRECSCDAYRVKRYRSRLSGPLLDRIDLHVEVPPVDYREMFDPGRGEPSSEVRLRVERARAIQRERFEGSPRGHREPCNAGMFPAQIERWVPLGGPERRLLERAVRALGLSARAHHRILRVARTLADLEGEAAVQGRHLAEAIHFRALDRPVD